MADNPAMHLRAVFGELEDGNWIFLGAVEEGTYEAIVEDDDSEGTSRWQERVQQWKDSGPYGIGDVREAWIRLQLDPMLRNATSPLVAPTFPAFAEPANQRRSLTAALVEGDGGEGHRVEITFDGGLEPMLTLRHPETGCDPGEGATEGCWLDGWLENADEPEGMLRGSVTVPVTYELDGDQPVFYLQPLATLNPKEGQDA